MIKPTTKETSSPFKKFLVGGKWADVFQLPDAAIVLWLYYYTLEGKKREGWAPRLRIAAALCWDKDKVTKWRGYLVDNGWLECVGYRNTKGALEGRPIPIMKVRHGVIPALKVNKGWNNLPKYKMKYKAVMTEKPSHKDMTENRGLHMTEKPSVVVTEKPSQDVDVEQIKPCRCQTEGLLGVVEDVVSVEKAFEILLNNSRLKLEDGVVIKPRPIVFDSRKEATAFCIAACEQMPCGYEVILTPDANSVEMKAVKICQYHGCDNKGVLNAYDGRYCAKHKDLRHCECCYGAEAGKNRPYCEYCDNHCDEAPEVCSKKTNPRWAQEWEAQTVTV